MLKRTHFSELSISRFTTRKRSQRPHDPRSEKSKLKMTGRPQIQRRIQALILQFHFNSLPTQFS